MGNVLNTTAKTALDAPEQFGGIRKSKDCLSCSQLYVDQIDLLLNLGIGYHRSIEYLSTVGLPASMAHAVSSSWCSAWANARSWLAFTRCLFVDRGTSRVFDNDLGSSMTAT